MQFHLVLVSGTKSALSRDLDGKSSEHVRCNDNDYR